jgi:dolichol kinase
MNLFLRKGWHLLGLAFPASYYSGLLSKRGTLFVVGAIFAVAVVLEVLRFSNPGAARVFTAVFGRLMRAEEHRRINATIPLLVSTFVAILIFPRVIACVALFCLALGDVAAELVGGAWGRVRLRAGKTLEGTLACLTTCFVVALPFLDWRLALAAAFGAATAELLSTGWTDNLTVPIAAGAAVWLVSAAADIGFPG